MKNLMNFNMMAVFMVAIVLVSCDNGKYEERIAALEERVDNLEGRNNVQSTNPNPNANPNVTSLAANVANEPVPDGPLPVFQFEGEEHDFGTIEAGTVVEHTFKFKNVGEAPLIIQSTSASCGCTVPSKPTQPIAVGDTGEIKVRFDSKNKSGAQSPVITITANTNPKIRRVKLKGTVTPKAQLPDGPARQ